MAQSYLQKCILEALAKAKGNETKARALIAAQALDDHDLLIALSKPHLSGIVAHAVGRQSIQIKAKKDRLEDLPPLPKPPSSKGTKENDFALDLLKALGGNNVAKFGVEDAAPRVGKKPASQQHVNALKLMAAKSKTNKKR
ncbi:MAG: hypothetical protein JNL76_07950 [Alphaproteobacteria bacterium]|nr:hypothetical protein [Alphaproteobacteria bacterium]